MDEKEKLFEDILFSVLKPNELNIRDANEKELKALAILGPDFVKKLIARRSKIKNNHQTRSD